MEKIDYRGWQDCIRLANDAVELIIPTRFGPRIMRYASIGGENLLHEDTELLGKVGQADTWVNYGGHRLWFAPEVQPLSYGPDNDPIEEASFEGNELVVTGKTEPYSSIQKQLRIEIAEGNSSAVKITHVLTNTNPWPIELAPWALSVMAEGGRVILPQEPYAAHGPGHFLPVRPLVLWSFTDMSDSRWTWGKELIQLRSDPALDVAQKVGIYNTAGWGAYLATTGDLFVKFIDVEDYASDEYPDMGSNFETYTKAAFQELETLGPIELLEAGDSAEHVEYWYLVKTDGLPTTDSELADAIEPLIEEAAEAISIFGDGESF